MNGFPKASFGCVLAAFAIFLFTAFAVPQTAHAHSSDTEDTFAEKSAVSSHDGGGYWVLGHCDDGPTCAGAKSLVNLDRLSVSTDFVRMIFLLETEGYHSAALGRDPPVPISIF